VALCVVPSVGEHNEGFSKQFRVYFSDNTFSVFVLIILFDEALKQARSIFYLKKAAQKSASFGIKHTCDITSCGLHKHLLPSASKSFHAVGIVNIIYLIKCLCIRKMVIKN
jgi:hypothetical protein